MKQFEKKLDGNNTKKNTKRCFEQILEATPNKTVFLRLLNSYLKNYPNKTNKGSAGEVRTIS